MEIEFGKFGVPAAVLNVRTGRVHGIGTSSPKGQERRSASTVFAALGGKLITSKGWEGVGTIPDGGPFCQIGVLNVNATRPRIPLRTQVSATGMRCVVLSLGTLIDARSTLAFVNEGAPEVEVFFVKNAPEAIRSILADVGQVRARGDRQTTLTSYGHFDPNDSSGAVSQRALNVKVYGAPRSNKLGLQRILELLLWEHLYSAHVVNRHDTTVWHQGLGLAVATDGKLYRNASGILRRPFLMDEGWQSRLDGNPLFLPDPRPTAPGGLYLGQQMHKPALISREVIPTPGYDNRRIIVVTREEATQMRKTRLLPESYAAMLLGKTEEKIQN